MCHGIDRAGSPPPSIPRECDESAAERQGCVDHSTRYGAYAVVSEYPGRTSRVAARVSAKFGRCCAAARTAGSTCSAAHAVCCSRSRGGEGVCGAVCDMPRREAGGRTTGAVSGGDRRSSECGSSLRGGSEGQGRYAAGGCQGRATGCTAAISGSGHDGEEAGSESRRVFEYLHL